MKLRNHTLLLSLLTALSLSACQASGTTTPNAASSATTGVSASANIQTLAQTLAGLTSDQAVQRARATGSLELLQWAQANGSASAEVKQSTAVTLLTAHPDLVTLLSDTSGGPGGAPGGMGGPGGMPPGGMGGPGGLPPNIEEIRTQYPELAAELEAMQSLTPEERRTKMDALIAAHPEYSAVLRPQGMGPGGMPPSGAPGGSPPPMPSASPSAA